MAYYIAGNIIEKRATASNNICPKKVMNKIFLRNVSMSQYTNTGQAAG